LLVDCKYESGGIVSGEQGAFDGDAFFAALDAARTTRRLNWKVVAKQAGVSASTLTRMAQGRRPDIDTFSALCRWAGVNADDYIRPSVGASGQEGPEALARISTYLRSDANLSDEAAAALDQIVKAAYVSLRNSKGQE